MLSKLPLCKLTQTATVTEQHGKLLDNKMGTEWRECLEKAGGAKYYDFYCDGYCGSVVVSLLFWGWANEVTSVAEAKKYYVRALLAADGA